MNDESIEQEIKTKGLTAPRVRPEDIEANIKAEFYFTGRDGVNGVYGDDIKNATHPDPNLATLGLLTFCVLVMRNGFTIVGKSACASPENFDAELGRKIARNDAVQQVWPLMGYALKETLHQQTL